MSRDINELSVDELIERVRKTNSEIRSFHKRSSEFSRPYARALLNEILWTLRVAAPILGWFLKVPGALFTSVATILSLWAKNIDKDKENAGSIRESSDEDRII